MINSRIKDHREAFVKEVEIDNRPTGMAKHALAGPTVTDLTANAAVARQDPGQEALEKVQMDRAVYSFPTMPSIAPSSMKTKATGLVRPDQLRSLLSSVPRAVLKQTLQEILDQEQIEAERQ